MILGYNNIKNDLKNEICHSFEQNYDFDALRKLYPEIDYYVLYSILYSTGRYNNQLYEHLCIEDIGDGSNLIISDTHDGSFYDNMGYWYKAFDFGIKNKHYNILHGGDVIQGNSKNRRGFDSIKQAEHFMKYFPSDRKASIYMLLGNHDSLAINNDPVVRDILSSRRDIDVLGFKKVFLRWNDRIISIQHEITDYNLILPWTAEVLSFKGHSHFYRIKKPGMGKSERIHIPSLSDHPVNRTSLTKNELKNTNIGKPGFLTSDIDGDDIIVTLYVFDNNKKIQRVDEYIKPKVRKKYC